MVEKVNIELLLVRKLAEDYLKSKITDLIELTGDASSRKYYRFLHSGKSYVACLASPFQSERDSDFYVIQKLMDSSGIKVPQIFSLKPNEGFYLEEDLGDSTLVSYLGSDVDKNVSIEKYKSILDILIKLQSVPTSETIVGARSFDQKKFDEESSLSIKYFLSSYLKASEEDICNKLFQDEISHMNKTLGENPLKVFSHRDLHSRNIMVKDEDLYLIDFQDARLGLPFYDLVSLLEDCYYPLKQEDRAFLIKYYKNKSPLTKNMSDKDFEYWYNMSAIQRLFKALGSFTYINATRGDDRYLKYVGVGVGRLLSFLEKESSLPNFYQLIKKTYHEN